MITNIIIAMAVTRLAIVSKPATLLRGLYGFTDDNYLFMGPWTKWFYELITCHLCLGFWVGWMMTGSWQMGVITAISAELLDKLNRYINV
jgi:hypothetical protein